MELIVDGSSNAVDVMQTGFANRVTGMTGEMSFLVSDTGNSLTVPQSGNSNTLMGQMSSTSGLVSVAQTGDFNTATVMQF